MKKAIIILIGVILLFSCSKGNIRIEFKKNKPLSNAQTALVSAINLTDNQIVLTGTNLNEVNSVAIKDGESTEGLEIVSQNNTQLVATPVRNVSFSVEQALNLIISDAHGSSNFQVTFTLQSNSVSTSHIQDGAITSTKLASMSAGNGQVLQYNGGTWGPADLSGLNYIGSWDANTNTPNLSSGGNAGDYYIVSTTGTTDLSGGPGTDNWNAADWVVWNNIDSQWEKIDNTTNGSWDPATGGINYAGGNVGIGRSTPGAMLEVAGEIRTVTSTGINRLWGQGRPNTQRHGTSGVEAGLCTNSAIQIGLSKHAVTWEGAAAACPTGTWVCTASERSTAACDTDRADDTSDAVSETGADADFAANSHLGWVADAASGVNDQTQGQFISEAGGAAGVTNTQTSIPVWCCSE